MTRFLISPPPLPDDALVQLQDEMNRLRASNKELLEALEECADDTQLDLRVADKARNAIAKAKEQK